jgi:hypothetical protein
MNRRYRLLAASYLIDLALSLLPRDIHGRDKIYQGMTEMFVKETRA